jgi:predicted ATPase/class 3 adenylate cyclase/DNA-binding XRE family transcriptional regulator
MESEWSLGSWIKRRRRALDLTQDDVAGQVGCSVALVCKIEGDARRPSRQVAALLARALAIPPEDQPDFVRIARGLLSPERLPPPNLADAPPRRAAPDPPPAPHESAQAMLAFFCCGLAEIAQLWERYPEAMPGALPHYATLLRLAIAQHGGQVFKVIDDTFFAVFAAPQSALAAAIESRRTLAAARWQAFGLPNALQPRYAIHSGVAEIHNGDYTGLPISRVARLCDAAHPGQILLSRASAEMLHDIAVPGVTLRELGIQRLKDLADPEEIVQADAPGFAESFPPLRTLSAVPTNLPIAPTSLIGRSAELAAVEALLASPAIRLLTLTGPGGIGKTRLAIQAAAERADAYSDGVWFVDLAQIHDSAHVAPAIMRVLELQDTGAQPPDELLCRALAPRHCLLVLDSCEYVLDAAPLIAGLLAAANRLTIMATSRAPLHLRAEHVHVVPPLSLPARHARTIPAEETEEQSVMHALAHSDAVALFVASAQAMDERFALTDENAALVAEICWRLDGLPLAIELAAARVRQFPPAQMLTRLEADGGLGVLTGGPRDLPARQQTLRATIGWSYDLLTPAEQILLDRLGVFAGSFSLSAAESIAGDLPVERSPATIADLIAVLEEHNLVALVKLNGEPRFALLDTVRAYAREQLGLRGELALMLERHAAHWAAWAEGVEHHLRGVEQLEWLPKVDLEDANLLAALVWALRTPPDSATGSAGARAIGLRLAGALWYYWFLRGRHREAYGWLECDATADESLPAAARARALLGAAFIEYITSWRAGLRRRDIGYTLAQQAGDSWLTLFGQAMTRDPAERERAAAQSAKWEERDPWLAAFVVVINAPQLPITGATRQQLEAGLALARHAGDRYLLVEALLWLSMVEYYEQRVDRLSILAAECRSVAEGSGFSYALTMAEIGAGLYSYAIGRLDEVIAQTHDLIARERALGNPAGVAAQRVALIRLHCVRGDLDAAESLFVQAGFGQPESPAGDPDRMLCYAPTYWSCWILLCGLRGDIAGALALLEPAERWPGDGAAQFMRHMAGGFTMLAAGDPEAAATCYRAAIDVHPVPVSVVESVVALISLDTALARAGLALALLAQGDLPGAQSEIAHYRPAIDHCMRVDDAAWLIGAAAGVQLAAGEPEAAARLLAPVLARVRVAGAAGVVAPLLECTSMIGAALGDRIVMRQLLTAARALRVQLGTPPWPGEQVLLAQQEDRANDAPDDAAPLSWQDAVDAAIHFLRRSAPYEHSE